MISPLSDQEASPPYDHPLDFSLGPRKADETIEATSHLHSWRDILCDIHKQNILIG